MRAAPRGLHVLVALWRAGHGKPVHATLARVPPPGEEEANSADGAAAAAAAAASAPSSLQQLQPKPPLVARTRAALGMLWELTEKAATPSTLLPPGAVPPPLDAPPPAKRQRLGEGGESSCQ